MDRPTGGINCERSGYVDRIRDMGTPSLSPGVYKVSDQDLREFDESDALKTFQSTRRVGGPRRTHPPAAAI